MPRILYHNTCFLCKWVNDRWIGVSYILVINPSKKKYFNFQDSLGIANLSGWVVPLDFF